MRLDNGTFKELRRILNAGVCSICSNPLSFKMSDGQDLVPEFRAECCGLEYLVIPEVARIHVSGS